MSENNKIFQSFVHQRSHSMPLGQRFAYNESLPLYQEFHEVNTQSYDFNRSQKQDFINTDNFPSKLAYTEYADNNLYDSNFFYPSKTKIDVYDRHNAPCPISITSQLTKGFFKSESYWTCYRRNYFQLTVSFSLLNYSDQNTYYLGTTRHTISQFLVRVRACVSSDDDHPNNIELTQMTPKRDKGPVREPPMLPICPTDRVMFERLQFKVATANNGRRKASQQFFRLVVELVAQLQDNTCHVVSTCSSLPLIVRGRSPGHYNDFAKKKMAPDMYGFSHVRSQSANDPHPFLARHRKSIGHDDSMDKALRQWELQTAKDRQESISAFHACVPENNEMGYSTLSHDNQLYH